MEPESTKLKLYMAATAAVAAPLLVLISVQAALSGITTLTKGQAAAIFVFSVVLIIGELFPIPVARGNEAGDEITVSSTFGFALLLMAPTAIAVAAQSLALAIDCVVRARRVGRLPFNIAQYALAFIAARFVYSYLAHLPFTPDHVTHSPDLLAALAAAGAFLLVNNFLVACAIALSVQIHLHKVLYGDLTWQIWTSAPLLGLGVLAAQAASWNPFSVALLIVPILALHRSGSLAMRREQEALRDNLTGLANRIMLKAETDRALKDGTGRIAMLLLDLDHFKDINDTLGHVVGDEMLQAVAARLSALAEPRDLVCRIGGDEFVVLRRRYSSMEQVRQFAEMLRAALQEPVVLHGVTLTVGCSVGIALAPEHAVTLEDLQRCADIALYAAKATRGAACFYDRLNDRHSVALLGLHADLRAALESEDDEQIWVAYQPQLDVASGRVHSLECLARWNHPQAGPVSPDVFVPIAENTALINLLLYRVLDRALAQLARWDAEGQHFHASLNLSARQVSDLALPDIIGQHLERHRIAPERIVLEVTESRLMDDPERSSQVLRGIRDLGVGLSIDDFGTGYSSLSYLQRLAVDELKIDKSFTAELSRSGDATIVRSTIDLGHNLGLRVVAEGVEDPDTAAKLRRLGCDVLQGFLVGRPMAPEELSAHLAALRPDLSDQGRPSSEWSAIDPNGPSRVQPLAQALLRGA